MYQFKDFNMKLAVIDVLMYELELLTPKFDIHEFVKKNEIDIEKEGYSVLPSVKKYFEQIMIPSELLSEVKEICQDGGEIYLQLYPFWNGEDDTFNIRSAEDVDMLPNLKNVILFYGGPSEQILESFRTKGVTAKWV